MLDISCKIGYTVNVWRDIVRGFLFSLHAPSNGILFAAKSPALSAQSRVVSPDKRRLAGGAGLFASRG